LPSLEKSGCGNRADELGLKKMPDYKPTMPAVTLWQPWAGLVEIGAKQYETRPFKIPLRLLGRRVAIHAAARACFIDLDQDVLDDIEDAFGRSGWNHWLPRGVIVATAILAESIPAEKVKPDSFGDYTPGRWAWRLEDVRSVDPPIPAKGRQRVGWEWTIPEGAQNV
jgi:activating signal cointegrator 1